MIGCAFFGFGVDVGVDNDRLIKWMSSDMMRPISSGKREGTVMASNKVLSIGMQVGNSDKFGHYSTILLNSSCLCWQ